MIWALEISRENVFKKISEKLSKAERTFFEKKSFFPGTHWNWRRKFIRVRLWGVRNVDDDWTNANLWSRRSHSSYDNFFKLTGGEHEIKLKVDVEWNDSKLESVLKYQDEADQSRKCQQNLILSFFSYALRFEFLWKKSKNAKCDQIKPSKALKNTHKERRRWERLESVQ